MKIIHKVINNVPSQLITWGNPFDSHGEDVIVCVTGNPGITDFYIEFGSELHKQTTLPVCVVGHAGHDILPGQDFNKLEKQDQLFNLRGQMEHKLDIIKNHIDTNSRVHIIGHSIGAWIIIELMDNNNFLREKCLSINLLFPTVQKMAESKNGIFLNNVVRRLHLVIMFFAYLLPLLPAILFQFFVTCYLKFNAVPLSYSASIKKFLNPKVIEKVLFLAYDEMDTVKRLNSEGVKKLPLQTNIIYSTTDGWVPVHYISDLKSIQPLFEMKQVDINHAFVLKSSEQVALMVSEYIIPKISKK